MSLYHEKFPESLKSEIETISAKCHSCGKCSSGCPVSHEADISPAGINKAVALAKFGRLLNSDMLWLCVSCRACVSRCPFEIDIPGTIDLLKKYVHENKIKGPEKPIRLFHRMFLKQIESYGRVHEAGFIGMWKMLSLKWFSDIFMGAKMFLKGKLPLFPEKIKDGDVIKKIFSASRRENRK